MIKKGFHGRQSKHVCFESKFANGLDTHIEEDLPTPSRSHDLSSMRTSKLTYTSDEKRNIPIHKCMGF